MLFDAASAIDLRRAERDQTFSGGGERRLHHAAEAIRERLTVDAGGLSPANGL